jgi:hypothetical protein
MSERLNRFRSARVGVLGALTCFAWGMVVGICTAQSEKPPPNVTSASVPFYPRVAQTAHISGVVKLRISTDGTRASSVEVESGSPLLGRAAEENIRTWKFDQHTPTTFEVIFRYILLSAECDSNCNCGDTNKNTVQLQLPTSVEVKALTVELCDPVVTRH